MKYIFCNNKQKQEKAITLIALVVTIVILLILSGITVAALTGDNGLIGKSGDAKNATERANEKEQLEVAITRLYDKRGNLDATKVVDGINKDIKNLNLVTATEGNFPVKVEYKNGHKYQITKDGDIMISVNAGDTAPDDANAIYSSGDYDAIIPSGFTVSKETGETSIENGLVVKDSNQNEWVWIPVSSTDLNKMYVEDTAGWNMLGTNIKTTYRTIDTTLGDTTIQRKNPGNNSYGSYKEPDTLSSYDVDQTYQTQAGFRDLNDMATKLRDDYKEMIDSIKENKGFYVGRYEIGKDESNNPQEKKGTAMNGVNWYGLYKACKSFSSGNIQSRMIWGCQWDQVCRFIKGNGADSIINDSTSYGNYSDSTKSTDISGTSRFNHITGRSEDWKIKNIYDIAGNHWEYTQEANFVSNRNVRGGGVFAWGKPSSVCVSRPDYSMREERYYSSRPILYLK